MSNVHYRTCVCVYVTARQSVAIHTFIDETLLLLENFVSIEHFSDSRINENRGHIWRVRQQFEVQ